MPNSKYENNPSCEKNLRKVINPKLEAPKVSKSRGKEAIFKSNNDPCRTTFRKTVLTIK
jgi:hypothetical protein